MMAASDTIEQRHDEAIPVPSQASAGKGKGGKGAVPPVPAALKGKGKGFNNAVIYQGDQSAKGHGKTLRPVSHWRQEIAARAFKRELAARANEVLAGAETLHNVTASEPGLPLKIIARLMDGREIALNLDSSNGGLTVKQELSAKLGISASRLKLVVGTTVLHDFQTLADKGVIDGDAMSVIILSPLHGCLHRSGLEVPHDVQESKMELNDAFAEMAKQRLLRVS
jgi:hypothetical protein